jgi:hypothetical protein
MVEVVNETVKLPSNLMSILRESYDSRQKVLDWMLSFAVIAVCIWAFWEPLVGMFPTRKVVPSQDVSGALPDVWRQPVPSKLYTYNLPSSRTMHVGIGPSSTRPPHNPSKPAGYVCNDWSET